MSLALATKVKFLALKPQVLKNCPVLGTRTALFFVPLKSCWKTSENSRKICKNLFCFPQLEIARKNLLLSINSGASKSASVR